MVSFPPTTGACGACGDSTARFSGEDLLFCATNVRKQIGSRMGDRYRKPRRPRKPRERWSRCLLVASNSNRPESASRLSNCGASPRQSEPGNPLLFSGGSQGHPRIFRRLRARSQWNRRPVL